MNNKKKKHDEDWHFKLIKIVEQVCLRGIISWIIIENSNTSVYRTLEWTHWIIFFPFCCYFIIISSLSQSFFCILFLLIYTHIFGFHFTFFFFSHREENTNVHVVEHIDSIFNYFLQFVCFQQREMLESWMITTIVDCT